MTDRDLFRTADGGEVDFPIPMNEEGEVRGEMLDLPLAQRQAEARYDALDPRFVFSGENDPSFLATEAQRTQR